MKVCCSSQSFARTFASGGLTQLEWVDLCAGELMLDGVEFVRSHFPRLDTEYVAQLKKLCTDRCLTVAGLHHDEAFDSGDVDRHVALLAHTLGIAAGLGAPVVRLGLGEVDEPGALAWRELVRGLSAACIQAKQYNITFAIEPRPHTLVSQPADVKRVFKECDSAWLRLAAGADILASREGDAWDEALISTVMVHAPMQQLDTFGADESIDYLQVLTTLWQRRYRGFVSIDYHGDEDESDAVARAVTWLRGMLAKDALRAAAVEPPA